MQAVMPEPMITTTAMHPTMNFPCGRHVWFSEQKLMSAQSLWVSQVPLWILFHSSVCVVFRSGVFVGWIVHSSGVIVGWLVDVSLLPKCLSAVLIGLYRWGELNNCQNPPTPGIMANRVSPRLRPSVVTLAGSPNRCGELSSWNTPPTPGIMETRVSSMLRSSVLLAAFAWFLVALESFASVCFLSISIIWAAIWTAAAASPCGSGLPLAPSILWTA